MPANQFNRHRKASQKLGEVFSDPEKFSAIHYSCESFYDLPDGRSPRITSIAVRNVASGQTDSFSIHQTAELRRIPMTQADIEPYYNELEKEMLDVFYQYLNTHTSQTFLHWNMRDQNYGFQAIEHRHRVLGGAPLVVPNDRKIDLSRLLIELYGVAYIGHPRLETLLTLNNITSQDFMTGKAEAEAFVEGKYVDLHRSTLRKVDIFCNLAVRTFDGKLKTNSSWKEIYGISWRALSHLVKNNPFYTTATVIAGLATASVSLFKATEYFRGP